MLAALNFVLGASIRRLWALRTQRKSIERDVCAPVVLAHQHVVAPIWVQRDPERINHNHKSRALATNLLEVKMSPSILKALSADAEVAGKEELAWSLSGLSEN